MATIMILDDDHSGIFGFADTEAEIVESVGSYELKVVRSSGARGSVGIPYSTEDGTAKEGQHYEAEEEKTAILGRPCLGPNSRIQIRIRESKEFASSVDKMMQKANNSMMQGSSSWLEQFTDALTVQVDDDEE